MGNETPRVVRGRVELIVDHEGKELPFIHPSQGPHNYQTVGRSILSRNLKIPTGDQTASLIYAAYNSEEPEFKEVRGIMHDNWVWVYNRNLWTPDGVYVVQDPNAVGTSEELTQKELESRLEGGESVGNVRFSKDRTVRFALKGNYRLGEHTPESLAEDGFMIASYSVDGARKLSEISTKPDFKNKSPYIWGVDNPKEPVQRVSALDSSVGDGLYVDGNDHGDTGGYAFGV